MTVDETPALVIVSNDVTRCVDLALRYQGLLYVDERSGTVDLPFTALLQLPADAPVTGQAEDLGVYRVRCRVLKAGIADVVALFPMIRKPSMSHAAADAHWRDQHAPLALIHHRAMSRYEQLEVTDTIAGVPYDGFALCGFPSLDDLKNRFYNDSDSVQVIADDVRRFADTRRSPRRLIAIPRVRPS